MAPFSFDLLDQEEQKKKDQDQNGQGPAPAFTGGGSSFGPGTPQQQPSQPAAAQGTAKQGSGFVNLDSYMKANQGSGFGKQFTGKIQDTVNSAKQGLDQNAADFTNASNQGTTRWNDIQGDVKGIVDNSGDKTTKDDASKLQGFEGASYKGPENFTGSAYGTQARGGLDKAFQQASAAQTEGGRFALLDQYFGRPTYNQGQKSLDNLLVQNGPGVGARVQSLGSQAGALSSDAQKKQGDLDSLATANKFATDDAAKNSRDYLNNAVSRFSSDLDSRYGASQKTNAADLARLQGEVGKDDFSHFGADQFGLKTGEHLYGVNLADYLKQTNPSKGEFASDADYAKSAALSQLAGGDLNILNPADRSKADTGSVGYSVDRGRLNADIGKSAQGYQKDLETAIGDHTRNLVDLQTKLSGLQAGAPPEWREKLQQAIDAENADWAQKQAALAKQYQADRTMNGWVQVPENTSSGIRKV